MASAQNRLEARKITSPPKDLGSYNIQTQSWQRDAGSQANLGADVIYRNDAFNGYFGIGWLGCMTTDEIMLPGPDNPQVGSDNRYLIDCWDFAYCAAGAGVVTFTFWYGDSYFPCDLPGAGLGGCANVFCQNLVSSAFTIPGLPAGTGVSGVGCWTVNITIADGYEFCLEADGAPCNPGYQGLLLGQDHALLAFQWAASIPNTLFSGPILAGNPLWVPRGYNTCYNTTDKLCDTGTGTGLGATVQATYGDGFGLCNTNVPGCGAAPGCYFFGGYLVTSQACAAASKNPLAQFQHVLYASCHQICAGNDGVYCDEAVNPFNVADISVSGKDVTGGSVITVDATNVPTNVNGYLIVGAERGVVQTPPGAKGALCLVGGCQGRYAADIQSSGAGGAYSTDIKNPTTACGMMGSGDYCLPGGCGPANIMPGDTWNFQYWHRQPMMQPASFSSAIKCTFE